MNQLLMFQKLPVDKCKKTRNTRTESNLTKMENGKFSSTANACV